MKPTGKKVIVSGGVAGRSAAHELTERGFAVEVHERQVAYVGGKARSTSVPGTATAARPGEPSLRFFHGFYRLVTDTTTHLPFAGNRQDVFNNLMISALHASAAQRRRARAGLRAPAHGAYPARGRRRAGTGAG